MRYSVWNSPDSSSDPVDLECSFLPPAAGAQDYASGFEVANAAMLVLALLASTVDHHSDSCTDLMGS